MSGLAVVAVAGVAAAVVLSRSSRARSLVLSTSVPVRPQFVLFGDSITQQSFGPGGWGAAVADVYQRTADITLRGYSGYNTRWALPLLPKLFPPGQGVSAPALVTIFFGANDANLPGPLLQQPASASRQCVPLDEYVDNLRKIVAAIRATANPDGTTPRVLLITPPPCDGDGWHAHCIKAYAPNYKADCEPNRSFEFTAKYAAACVRLGAETGTPVLDLHSEMTSHDSGTAWKGLLLDGLHPNQDGGKFIATAVLRAIETHFPELKPSSFFDPDPAKLPMDFPDHKAIDIEDVQGSFSAHRR